MMITKKIFIKKTAVITACIIIIVIIIFIVIYAVDFSFTGTVIKVNEHYIVVKLDEKTVYRSVLSKHRCSEVKLYTSNAVKFIEGDRLYAFTKSGSEDSIPPGIAGMIVFKLNNNIFS